jgi:hypothetical protein
VRTSSGFGAIDRPTGTKCGGAEATGALLAVPEESRATGASTRPATNANATTMAIAGRPPSRRGENLLDRMGRSISTQLAAVAAAVAPRRTAMRARPETPVVCWSSTRNSGQCQRYTP